MTEHRALTRSDRRKRRSQFRIHQCRALNCAYISKGFLWRPPPSLALNKTNAAPSQKLPGLEVGVVALPPCCCNPSLTAVTSPLLLGASKHQGPHHHCAAAVLPPEGPGVPQQRCRGAAAAKKGRREKVLHSAYTDQSAGWSILLPAQPCVLAGHLHCSSSSRQHHRQPSCMCVAVV